MRVTIPHSLGRDEARRRLKDNIGSLSGFMPGGLAQVAATWPDENTMAMTITAMGQTMEGRILVEESQALVEVVLPPALSFVEPMIQGAIEKSGRKLLT